MRRPIFALAFLPLVSVHAGAQASPGRVLGARAAARDVAIKMFVPSGSVRIATWDRDSVVVRGRVSRSDHFYFVGKNTGMKLGIEPRRTGADIQPADLVVMVPRRAEISLKAVDASVTAENVGGWFYTVSGPIRLSGAATHVEAESIRGDVDVDMTVTLVKARTGRGHMTVRGAPEDVDASTVEGPLDVAAPGILRARFSSVTGDIRYAGAPAAGGIYEFSDHSGTVDLALPRSTSSALELSSVSGFIENGFSSVRPAAGGPRSLSVRLGRGDAHLTVRTFKGPIRLRVQQP